jgi:hypothetical protein
VSWPSFKSDVVVGRLYIVKQGLFLGFAIFLAKSSSIQILACSSKSAFWHTVLQYRALPHNPHNPHGPVAPHLLQMKSVFVPFFIFFKKEHLFLIYVGCKGIYKKDGPRDSVCPQTNSGQIELRTRLSPQPPESKFNFF